VKSLAFLICVEHGRLESEAVLLVESLRTWGGGASEAPVYAFAPRAGRGPEPATIERLEAMGTTIVEEPLVERFADHPTFNKVAVSAWAERELDHETLVFSDTDSVFLSEPSELLGGDWLAAVRPVDRRIAGSRGKGKNEPFWRKMYAELGVRSEPFTETTVGQVQIRAYWNTGLLAARRSAGLFEAWQRALIRLFDAGIVQKRWPQFMDQLSWAGVTADLGDDLLVLSDAYNYPLRHRQALKAEVQELDLAEIVQLHYRLWLHMPDALAKAYPPFDPDGDRYRWLEERLPLEPIVEEAYSQ
jgi:hypothetical protein